MITMCHNIDVTPASSTTYDHHVSSEPHLKENQNGERSDAEHNDRRKHDYKSNRENKKAKITTKKKRNPNKITYQQTQITKTFTS